MKRIFVGVLIGLAIGLSTQAYAAVGDRVEAVFAHFNVIINGQETELETMPLVYNGTSYLPVRELANKFGYDVTYKADSRTIEINNAEEVLDMPVSEGATNDELSARLELLTRVLKQNEDKLQKFRDNRPETAAEYTDLEREAEKIIENLKLEIADLKSQLGIEEGPTE